MYSFYLMLALIAYASASPVGVSPPSATPAEAPTRTLEQRQVVVTVSPSEDPVAAPMCPSATGSLTEDTVKRVLNQQDIMEVVNNLGSWCDKGGQIPPNQGSQGQTANSDAVVGQLCNLNNDNLPCNSSYINFLFNGITCGTYENPTMGSAIEDPWYQLYVSYAPVGQMPNCMSAHNLYEWGNMCPGGKGEAPCKA